MTSKRSLLLVAIMLTIAAPRMLAQGTNTFPASGNTGIGTTSPNRLLEVGSGIPSSVDTSDLRLAALGALAAADSAGSAVYLNMTDAPFSNAGEIGAFNYPSNTFLPLHINGSAIVLGDPGRGNANVGIGTASPTQAMLQLAAPDKSVESAIAIRQSNNAAFGFDLALDQQVDGMGYIYGVAGFTKTALEQFDRIHNYVLFNGGNVGIGTASPAYKLDVTGSIHASQAINASGGVTFADGSSQTTAFNTTLCGGDYAESVDVTGDRAGFEPGDVLVLDEGHPGNVRKSAGAYSTVVSGIYSTRPGAIGRRQTTPKSTQEIPMAMVGIVPTKVSTENGAIRVGDLLVSSSRPGYAMRGTDRDRMLGAVIGKAMGALDSGTGVIDVLVTIQ